MTTTPTTVQTIRLAIIREMEAEGYRRGTPGREAAQIDASVCAESACSQCGHIGLTYLPFIRPATIRPVFRPRSYRAYACCSVCGFCEEF